MIKEHAETVGKTIKKLRLDLHLSQEVLSGFAGIARTHLTMIENGDKLPNLETIWRLADGLGMPPHMVVREIEDAISKKIFIDTPTIGDEI